MIHLTHEGPEPTPEQKRELAERYNRIFGNHIIVRRDFTGKNFDTRRVSRISTNR